MFKFWKRERKAREVRVDIEPMPVGGLPVFSVRIEQSGEGTRIDADAFATDIAALLNSGKYDREKP